MMVGRDDDRVSGPDPMLRDGDRVVVVGENAEPNAGADPEWTPLTWEQIKAMSREEARARLVLVARKRTQPGLSDDAKERLRSEFDLLLERMKRP